MFHKPVYAYARGWFTNHFEMFLPVHARHAPRELARLEFIENNRLMRMDRLDEYTDWFLAQLLARQVNLELALADPAWLQRKVYRLSYQSFVKYGEDIFLSFD
jgi:hypothetical protein